MLEQIGYFQFSSSEMYRNKRGMFTGGNVNLFNNITSLDFRIPMWYLRPGPANWDQHMVGDVNTCVSYVISGKAAL